MSKAEDMLWVSQVVMFDNKQAFNHLVKKYQSPIRRLFKNLTKGDVPLSEDFAQETFIKAYLNIRSFRGVSAFSTWLYRVAYNTYYDSARARKYYDDLDIAQIDNYFYRSNEYSSEKNDVYTAMQLLKKDERVAILLFYMEDKTQKDIAKIMNLPLGTVKTNILKGKEKMGKFLKDYGYGK
ncbi:MAG: sigma-70 family RNA polymerase sigma factor [Paludibacteraceae bacterium]